MNPLRRSLAGLAGVLALLVLAGCNAENPTNPNGTTALSFTTEEEVVDIEAPDDEEAGLLTTSTVEYFCGEDGPVEDEYEYEQHYAILNGFLYLWTEDEWNDCTASKFAGKSSTIQGTWTSEDLSVRIPLAYRPSECDGVSPGESAYESSLFEDEKVTLTISNTKMQTKGSATLCMAPIVSRMYEDAEDVEEVSSECSTVKLKNTEVNRTATITVGYKKDSLVQVIAYNGHTCRYSFPFFLENDVPPTCSDDGGASNYEEYSDCLVESEFKDDFEPYYGEEELLKRTRGFPRGVVRNLARSLAR
jgi:hypothetical protein